MSEPNGKPVASPWRKRLAATARLAGRAVLGFLRGVAYWKESTIFLPLAIGLAALICVTVILLTGRALLNDLGDMVDFGKAAVKLAIVIAMVGWTQESLFGYRTESGPTSPRKAKPPLADDLHDSCVTLALLSLFLLAVGFWL